MAYFGRLAGCLIVAFLAATADQARGAGPTPRRASPSKRPAHAAHSKPVQRKPTPSKTPNASQAPSNPADDKPAAGTNDRAAMEEAKRAIPLSQLNKRDQARVREVLNDQTLFRRLPAQTIDCDQDLYRFLVEHPDVVVNLWKVMDVADISIQKTGERTFRADDGAGTLADIEYLVSSENQHLLYANGKYHGALFSKAMRGKCVLLLSTSQVQDETGATKIRCRLDAFMKLESLGAELLAKTFQPFLGKVADHNFRETALFMQNLSKVSVEHQDAMLRFADKLDRVSEDDRLAFEEVIEGAAERTIVARAEERPTPPSIDTRSPSSSKASSAGKPPRERATAKR